MKSKNLKSNKSRIISGPFEIFPDLYKDSRGYFYESWNQKSFNKLVGKKINFVQDNESMSFCNVIRGLHYQLDPKPQAKLVKVIKGKVYDVIVDLRLNSKTFGEWTGLEISETKKNQLWIPVGFAHGFMTISDYAILQYKVTDFWSSEDERCLLWNDKKINIIWPELFEKSKGFNISDKDAKGLTFEEAKINKFLFS